MKVKIYLLSITAILLALTSCVKRPDAAFIMSSNNIGTYNVISFTNTSSAYSTCLWDFGDGTTSTLPNPSHYYVSPGTYRVILTANGNSSSSQTSQIVSVYQSGASFTTSITSSYIDTYSNITSKYILKISPNLYFTSSSYLII